MQHATLLPEERYCYSYVAAQIHAREENTSDISLFSDNVPPSPRVVLTIVEVLRFLESKHNLAERLPFRDTTQSKGMC